MVRGQFIFDSNGYVNRSSTSNTYIHKKKNIRIRDSVLCTINRSNAWLQTKKDMYKDCYGGKVKTRISLNKHTKLGTLNKATFRSEKIEKYNQYSVITESRQENKEK